MSDLPWVVDTQNPESFLNYECNCGANFPLAENRVDKNVIRCPACGIEYQLKEGAE